MTQNISMEEYSRITPQIEDLTERWSKNCHIDRALYQKYDVKRGLRDANGRGVLASLTRISEVKGYTVDGNDTIPCEGVLYYRGYDVRELVNGSLSDKRFGFEETIYLLLFGELPTAAQLEEFRGLLNDYCRPCLTSCARAIPSISMISAAWPEAPKTCWNWWSSYKPRVST